MAEIVSTCLATYIDWRRWKARHELGRMSLDERAAFERDLVKDACARLRRRARLAHHKEKLWTG